MIRRIYIDNFRCFTSFECQLQDIQLFLGRNGVGKSSVLDVLKILQGILVDAVSVDDNKRGFLTNTLTRWESRPQQTFELEIEGNGGVYQYRLEVEHKRETYQCRIQSEELKFDTQRLYYFDGTEAHLYRDDPSWDPGPAVPYNWSSSFIASIPERKDNQKLVWFRDRVRRIFLYAIDPLSMASASNREQETPDRAMHQLASWLRHVSQEELEAIPAILNSLKGVLEGLVGFRLEKSGDTARTLKFEFEDPAVDKSMGSPGTFWLPLDELSEGQRCLVALFTIMHASVKPDCSVFIDEPNNFVALEEIQPWLVELNEKAYDSGCQLGLVSHHPSVANFLASNHGLLVFRDGGGPARSKPFAWDIETAESPAEVIARGME